MSGVMKGVLAVSLALGSAAAGRPAAAQSPTAVGYRNVFSINPLGIPFEYIAIEYERMVSPMTSLGFTGSYFGAEWLDGSYATGEAKLRFYPNEEGPKGFSLGLAAGITRVSEDVFDADDRVETRPTAAVLIDYNWILGKSKRIVVGTGLGAKRIFGVGDDFNDLAVAYPTARFLVGIRY
jgi:hypothetical protein